MIFVRTNGRRPSICIVMEARATWDPMSVTEVHAGCLSKEWIHDIEQLLRRIGQEVSTSLSNHVTPVQVEIQQKHLQLFHAIFNPSLTMRVNDFCKYSMTLYKENEILQNMNQHLSQNFCWLLRNLKLAMQPYSSLQCCMKISEQKKGESHRDKTLTEIWINGVSIDCITLF